MNNSSNKKKRNQQQSWITKAKAKANEKSLESLVVTGYECKYFRDADQWEYLNKEKHLIGWMGSKDYKIDRYDGRALLDDERKFKKNFIKSEENRSAGYIKDKDRIDYFRYYYLNVSDDQMTEQNEITKRSESESKAGFHCVPLAYEEETPEEEPKDTQEEGNQNDIDTEKVDMILEHTAEFIIKNGHKFEPILRNKCKDNKYFGFLQNDNPRYLYYQQLLETLETEQQEKETVNTNINSDEKAKTTILFPLNMDSNNLSDDLESKIESGFSLDSPIKIEIPTEITIPKTHQTKIIIEKFAYFITLNGDHFEKKIKDSSNDTHFGFLLPWDSNNAYYQFIKKNLKEKQEYDLSLREQKKKQEEEKQKKMREKLQEQLLQKQMDQIAEQVKIEEAKKEISEATIRKKRLRQKQTEKQSIALEEKSRKDSKKRSRRRTRSRSRSKTPDNPRKKSSPSRSSKKNKKDKKDKRKKHRRTRSNSPHSHRSSRSSKRSKRSQSPKKKKS